MYVEDDIDPVDGYKVPCDALVFNEGDFVDVCVGFDIVSKKGRDGRLNVRVHLNIEHVLLLVSGPDVEPVGAFNSVYCKALTQKQVNEESDEFAVQAPGLIF
jgi:hypothetical protein